MAFDLQSFGDPDLHVDYLEHLVDHQSADTMARLGRFWNYLRNELIPASGTAAAVMNSNSRPYFQAQEVGLPPRITGVSRLGSDLQNLTDLNRKEVVIENDIAWRVHTMIDFLFGRSITVRSLASDPFMALTIEQTLQAMLEANGSVGFLQEMALFGAVYGFVDIALRTPADGPASHPTEPSGLAALPAASPSTAGRPGTSTSNPEESGESASSQDGPQGPDGDRSKLLAERAVAAARSLHLETVEAPRVLPILDENDYRSIRYWVQRYHMPRARMSDARQPWYAFGRIGRRNASPAVTEVVEIIGPSWWQRYEDRQLVSQGPNAMGRIPVVHIQNVAVPGAYEGLSDVEPLIPLQDELNTRLSDRANRVTYQSFKMYLGKGIDDFLERPVGPGQMWATQNLQASIEEFGNDDGSPSEDAHIEQVRQAMDKVSAVTPLAAGLIRGNVGNLTSGTALKVVLGGLLARTAKKRLAYGQGLQRVAELALEWLALAGVLPTAPADRRIEIHWPEPLPIDEGEQLRNAQIKAQLGIPTERIMSELGYGRDVIAESRTE